MHSHHGFTARTQAVRGIVLSETVYEAGTTLPSHSHEDSSFCFVLQGSFTEIARHQSQICAPQTLLARPAGDRHANQFHSSVRCLNVQLDAAWRARMDGAEIPERALIDKGQAPGLASRIYREFRDMDDASPLVIEGLTLEVLGETLRLLRQGSVAPPSWLRRVRDLLHDRFREPIVLAAIAREVGVHEAHLSREFRRQYRCTAGEYLRRLRIEFACRQLALTNAPLSAIATNAGFFDQSHLARRFKQSMGVSPAQYRRWLRAR